MILAQKTDRTRSSYWLVRPGSIHESLVQLSLGDTVEKCHAWSPPPSFLSLGPTRVGPSGVIKKWIKKGDFCYGLCHPLLMREVASVPSQAPTMS